ncbi:hypothetical protein EHS25_002315 [Saitozyma podzolica]|uniref:Uncharacterized protein n=1 Tax=Saitozyma podzolica TaxID=1890683 RepID=A0A427YDR8_9TREE|nr:hypothetical protein EHS25_002315 [Saitozyma podzolica]
MSLSQSLQSFWQDFLASCPNEGKLSQLAVRFDGLGNTVKEQTAHGGLTPQERRQAETVSHNVLVLASAIQRLSKGADEELNRLSEKVAILKLNTPRGNKRPAHDSAADGEAKVSRWSNRRRETEICLTQGYKNEGADPIRLWFLHHLADPYPTPLQKRNLSTTTSIPVPASKPTSRTGVAAPAEEKDPEIIKEVEGVQKYLRKEEEGRVGEWVYQLAELAKKAQAPSDDTVDNIDDEQDAGDASPPLIASSDASPSSTSTSDRSDLLLQTPHSSSSSHSSSLDSSSPPVPARQIIHPPPGDTAYNHRTLSTTSSFSSLSASSAVVRATPRSTSTNSNTSSTSNTSGISSVSAASVALGSITDAASLGANLRRRTSSVRSTAEGEIEYLADAPTDGNFSFTPFSFFPSPASTTSASHTYAMNHEYATMPGYQPVYYVPSNAAHVNFKDELHPGIKRPADADSLATGSRSKDAKYQQHTPSGDEHAPWVFNHPLGPPTGFSLGTHSPSVSTPSKRATRPDSHPVNHFAQDGASPFAIPEYPLAYSAAMWSTIADLPLLPHMVAIGAVGGNVDDGADAARESKGWALPNQHDFELSFPDWA